MIFLEKMFCIARFIAKNYWDAAFLGSSRNTGVGCSYSLEEVSSSRYRALWPLLSLCFADIKTQSIAIMSINTPLFRDEP